jgi:hypothetical protein
MTVFVFISGSGTSVFGFTEDPNGVNLPKDLKPWHRLGFSALQVGSCFEGMGTADQVRAAIARDGYFLRKADALIRRRPKEPPCDA